MDGWMDGWMDGCFGGFIDVMFESITFSFNTSLQYATISTSRSSQIDDDKTGVCCFSAKEQHYRMKVKTIDSESR